MPQGSIYVPVDFAKEIPHNTAQAVVNAMVRALRFIQASTPDQTRGRGAAGVLTPTRALYKAALIKNLDGFKHDGFISLDASQNVYRDLKTFDPGVQSATVDLAKNRDT
jgi:NitT/TauT family transport system substrate-binding protein